MTTITASHPVVSLPSLTSLDCIEITVEVRISYKTIKVIIPLSDDDCDTFRFLEGGSSNILEGFIHSVVGMWLSENLSYNYKVVNYQVNSLSELHSLPTYKLPPLNGNPVRYNLHTVDIEEEEGIPSYTLEYLCDDTDWAHAVINYHHGRNLRCDVSLNDKQYYPGIEIDHPNAKIIPPMRKETREDLMGLR